MSTALCCETQRIQQHKSHSYQESGRFSALKCGLSTCIKRTRLSGCGTLCHLISGRCQCDCSPRDFSTPIFPYENSTINPHLGRAKSDIKSTFPVMTGHAPAGTPPRIYRTRRDQLQKMLNLQRRLDSIKACKCPEDCLGIGRVPLAGSEGENPGDDHQKSGDPPADTPGSKSQPSSSNSQPSNSNNPPSSRQHNTRNTFPDNNLPWDTVGDTSDFYSGGPTQPEDDSAWYDDSDNNDGAPS